MLIDIIKVELIYHIVIFKSSAFQVVKKKKKFKHIEGFQGPVRTLASYTK